MVKARGLGVFVCSALSACSTSATITRNDGMSVEGWIQGGTPDTIVVEPRIGERREIRRSEIAEIDHPGNVHILVGGITLGYGGLIAAAGAAQCGEDSVDCGALFIPALVGAGIMAWGLVTWTGSKDAAAGQSLRRPPVKERPPSKPRPPEAPPPPSVLPPAGEPSPPAVLPPLPQKPSSRPGEPSLEEAPPSDVPEPPPEPPSGVTW
jgi:hypothetical protein